LVFPAKQRLLIRIPEIAKATKDLGKYLVLIFSVYKEECVFKKLTERIGFSYNFEDANVLIHFSL
jgi:hypothetical protein